MKRYREVNALFLATIAVVLFSNLINFSSFISNSVYLILISQIIIVLPALVYLLTTKQNISQAIGIRPISASNVILLIFFTFCMSPVMTFINALSRLIARDVTITTMSKVTEQNPFFISLICIAVVPALFEESIYRGVFFQEYRKVNPRAAIFMSAFLFGLLHGNLNQFCYAFAMGIVFALVVEATDTIISTMILHFISNGFSVILLYMLPKLSSDYDELLATTTETLDMDVATVFGVYGVRAVIFGIAGVLIYIRIAKNCGRFEHIKELFARHKNVEPRRIERKESLWTLPLVIAVGVMVLIIISGEFIKL